MLDEVNLNAITISNLQCFRRLRNFQFNKHKKENVRTEQIVGSKRKITGVFSVRGVSFTVKYGERFVILGANSCGATPLILSILGINQQVHGNIEVFGGLSNDFVFKKNKFQGVVGY